MQAAGRSTQRYGTQLAQWQQRLQWLVPQRVALRRQTLERYRGQVGMQAGAQVRHRLLTVQQQQALLQRAAQARLQQAGQQLQQLHRLVAQLSPQAVLNRGFAMLMQQEKVITSGRELKKEVVMQTITRDATVTSTIQEIIPYEPTDI
jgi:exodeoxyribonuclease VII large subunit